MGNLPFVIIAVILAWQIYSNTGGRRLVALLFAVIFIPYEVVAFSFPLSMPVQRLLLYVFFAAEYFRPSNKEGEKRSFPLGIALFLLFISMILTGVFDGRLSVFQRLYRPITTFVESFLVIAVSFKSIYDKKERDVLVRFLIYGAAASSVYGLFVYATKTNPYSVYVSSTNGAISWFEKLLDDVDRFRVNGFQSSPFVHGYVSAVIFYYLYFSRNTKWPDLFTKYAVGVLLITNIILSNCRTVLMMLAIGVVLIQFFGGKLLNALKFSIIAICACALLVQIPVVGAKLELITDLFTTGGTSVNGSNAQMRTTQLAGSIDIFYRSPVFGNGFSYIQEGLGYASNAEDRLSEDDLAGFESYGFSLLIEQGIVGILGVLIFFGSILAYFWSKNGYSKRISAIGIATTISFLFFSLSTGVLGTFLFTMIFLGVLIRECSDPNAFVDPLRAENAGN